jgi:Zn-dependent peptidase ImmA (M78 family)
MNNQYQNYQKARDASWNCLIEFGVTELPVSVSGILRAKGIGLGRYCDNKTQLEKNGLAYLMKNDGFTLKDSSGTIRVYFNEAIMPQRCRFTLAHELGHICLNHLGEAKIGQISYTAVNREPVPGEDPLEMEANIFASRLLAPACVLKEIGAVRPEQIAGLCGISMTAAQFRAERLHLLTEREQDWISQGKHSCFYLSTAEQAVFRQFSAFIQTYQNSLE